MSTTPDAMHAIHAERSRRHHAEALARSIRDEARGRPRRRALAALAVALLKAVGLRRDEAREELMALSDRRPHSLATSSNTSAWQGSSNGQ